MGSYIPYIIICVLLLVIIGVWYAIRQHRISKKEKELSLTPPEELIQIFNQLEEARKNNPQGNPYEMYWDIIKNNYVKGGIENGTRTIDTRTGAGIIQENGIGQEPSGVQSMDGSTDAENKERPKRHNRHIERI